MKLKSTVIWAGAVLSVVAASSLAHPLREVTNPALLMLLEAPRSGERYGAAVASAGDVDGDGREDIAVGAPRDDDLAPGRVYVHAAPLGELLYVIVGSERGDRFGSQVCSGPDVDGDGVPELWIGAPGAALEADRVAVRSGLTGLRLNSVDARRRARGLAVLSGRTGIEALDMNGDGHPERLALVGEPGGETSVRIMTGDEESPLARIGPYPRRPAQLSFAAMRNWREDGRHQLLVGVLGRTESERDRVEVVELVALPGGGSSNSVDPRGVPVQRPSGVRGREAPFEP